EKGLSVFDLPAAQVQTDIIQWQPILNWLHPIMQAARTADDLQRTPPRVRASTSAVANDAPTCEPAPRVPDPISSVRQHALSSPLQTAVAASALRRLRDALPIPRFLQRTP
ncbi:MAG TPA: hypothetical protein VNQ74_12245, partial [Burkholderiaceae bacterium]|nr:hypothetical protein [Burkholderiaceae bacterium]